MTDVKLYETQGSFCAAMTKRLAECETAGHTGWDDPAKIDYLRSQLATNFSTGNMVDVANIAMILWYHQQQKQLFG